MSNDAGDSPLACRSPAKSEINSRFGISFHDPSSPMMGDERRKVLFESKFLRTLSGPMVSGLAFATIKYVNTEVSCRSPN